MRHHYQRRILYAFVVFGLTTLAIWAGYNMPLARNYDVGSETVPLFGAYGNEHNNDFSYAYTSDKVTLLVPHVGARPQIVGLWLGGPELTESVAVQIRAGNSSLPLGDVREKRLYHLLVPTDNQGSARLLIESATVTLVGDSRPLGVLIDRLQQRSTTTNAPPLFVLLVALLVVGGVATGSWRLNTAPYLVAVALAGVLSIVTLLTARGRIELPPLWWLAAVVVFALGSMAVLRGERFARVQSMLAVVSLFAVWRIGLWLVASFGLWFSGAFSIIGEAISRDGNYYERDAMVWNTFVQGWTQWDSEHYTTIANLGYSPLGVRWPNIAFFPLYPLLIKPVALFVGNYNTAGVVVANLALLGALLVLHNLVERDFGARTARWTVIFTLLVPTSFFFGAVYSESVALLLFVGAIWAIRRERWWLAGATGFCLALARVPGIMIAPVLALAYFQHVGWRWRLVRWPILAAGLPPLGLAIFMVFQWQKYGTPFAFMQAQQAWENSFSPPWAMPINLYTMISSSPNWPILAFQALFYIVFVVLIVVALRRLPLTYGVSNALILIPPLLSSWTWSVSRHMVIGFAASIVLAEWAERRWVRWCLIAVMLPLLVIATLLFVNGWWIA